MTKSKLMNYLEGLDVREKKELINTINSIDDTFEGFDVFDNDDEFFSIFFQDKPQEVARAIYFGDYNFNDDYICFNAYGNLKTYDCFEYNNTFIDYYLEDVAEWLLENVNQWDYLNIDLEDDEDEDEEE